MARCIRALPAMILLAAGHAYSQGNYVNFETVPTRPLALSPDGTTLAATDTPDNRVELFSVTGAGLAEKGSLPVGLEPVAVNFRTDSELWVVNHLSDSVSIVDLSLDPPRVVRTLQVGDEPTDVVFGGTKATPSDPFPRAFVAAARRGQNHPDNTKSELLTPGIGRADVWVFDAGSLPGALIGNHETIVQVFGDKPRNLAVTPDGATVYVAIFHSGSQTTAILETTVCTGGESASSCVCDGPGGESCEGGNGLTMPGGVPGPNEDSDSPANPAFETGIIVKWDGSAWRDALNRDWSNAVPFSLPDKDVFAIDATANPPVESRSFSDVGTILFGMAVHPTSGILYVANTRANNADRFEGPDIDGPGPLSGLRGHLHEARINLLKPTPFLNSSRHLNKHIDYGPDFPVRFNGGGNKSDSLATPVGIEFSADGQKLYVAAFGSGKIGVFQVSQLGDDSFFPDSANHITLSGLGPAGMVRDDTNNVMYVYTRLNNSVASVDLSTNLQLASYPLHDVEPSQVTLGRRFLYDADFTSDNGEASCAACHIFGDKDDLAWNLGAPSGVQASNPNPFVLGAPLANLLFHPLKGPMTTQTLRGMADMGPMHWRGDRTELGDELNELLDFKKFNVAFEGLLAREAGEIPDADMTAYGEFALTLTPPPNPHRQLDNDLCTASEVSSLAECFFDEGKGRDEFIALNGNTSAIVGTDAGFFDCADCHTLDEAEGHFGGNGFSSFDGETQDMKVPHLRNLYDKHGMFGTTSGDLAPNALGDQIRGFGVLHNGAVANVIDFVNADVFQATPTQKEQITAYMFVFESNLAPSVGQQVTLTPTSGSDVTDRITLLRESAQDAFALKGFPDAKECSLTVKGAVSGEPRGWLMDSSTPWNYTDDKGSSITHSSLLALVSSPGDELTFTCVYPQGGTRIGIDRNEDGILDGRQCGDVSGDGIVADIDPAHMRLEFAGLGTMPYPLKCNVTGPNGSTPAECDIADAAAAIRFNNGIHTLSQGCTL